LSFNFIIFSIRFSSLSSELTDFSKFCRIFWYTMLV
jgi:hypothetical protein